MKICKALALAALALCAGCSSFRYEPTANWWREGGRICAASRDTADLEWRRDAPRSCAQANAHTPPLGK